MQFHIQLGKHIGIENTRFRNVPDGCGLYDVPNDELLNGLILGHATGTVGTANRLHVAAALFGTTIVPSLLGHLGSEEAKKGPALGPTLLYSARYLRSRREIPPRRLLEARQERKSTLLKFSLLFSVSAEI